LARKTVDIVVGALRAGEGFTTAQAVHSRAVALGHSVSVATVYRTLRLLADAGTVDQMVGDDAQLRYRFCGDAHHHHLVCRSCGLTLEVEAAVIENWTNEMAQARGFIDVRHILEISGVCSTCSA
jgi:Fur family ferric uptake transcriptional regulator